MRGTRRASTRAAPLGSHGHPAVWAFYPNKQMTTGEGGAVTTGSADEHELLVSLRNQGRLETSSWLQHGRLGYNYRLDDLSAALGIGQLEKLDRILEARRAVAAVYAELLRGCRRRVAAARRRRPRPLVVRLRREAAGRVSTATASWRGSRAQGVASAPYLPSIHLQSYMRERYGFREGMLPVSEDCSARTMALPFHARLERDDQEQVAAALRAALASFGLRGGRSPPHRGPASGSLSRPPRHAAVPAPRLPQPVDRPGDLDARR